MAVAAVGSQKLPTGEIWFETLAIQPLPEGLDTMALGHQDLIPAAYRPMFFLVWTIPTPFPSLTQTDEDQIHRLVRLFCISTPVRYGKSVRWSWIRNNRGEMRGHH